MVAVRLLGVGLVALLAACQGNPPIHNVQQAPIVAAPGLGVEDVQRAIINAGSERGWKMIPVAPGRILAIHNKPPHSATVDITFDTTGYSIAYVSSALLQDKGTGTIHPAYNRWIQQLQAGIDSHLQTLGAMPVPPAAPIDPGVAAEPGAAAVPGDAWQASPPPDPPPPTLPQAAPPAASPGDPAGQPGPPVRL